MTIENQLQLRASDASLLLPTGQLRPGTPTNRRNWSCTSGTLDETTALHG